MLAQVQDVDYRFKGEAVNALSAVSFTLEPGEVLGLIGPDGAGKTTLLRLMAGLLKPQTGTIFVQGLDPVHQHAEMSAQVGYMTQNFSLYSDLTVGENMRLFARLKGIPSSRAEKEASELLRVAGLDAFRERLAGKLSGGMKQKLALICALYGHPPVLLLDEPGVGVDPVSRRDLWQLVEQARGEGRGIVWSTAYMDEAERCDRVCVLHEGRVRFLGKPEELLAPLRGRVFAVAADPAERMPLLRRLQAEPRVMDAMIEGPHVRFLLRERPSSALLPGMVVVEPNVEEAFINLLGGVPGHRRPPRPEVPQREQGDAPLIVTEGLTKKFGDFTAPDNLSIRVKRGEIFGILGANGAGKTTAFRMMCGLIPATSGKATMLGIDLLRHAREARSHLGYMAQKFSLYGTLSVRQNLRFFASVYGLRGEHRKQRMAEVAERFDLLPYMNHSAGALPLGIRQRLSMACATLHEPEFLFLDEPTSGVDPFARREFWEEINEMAAAGVTIIVTTHFMDEAQYLHRMVIMNQGRVIAEGTPEELKAAAASAENPHPTMEDAFIHYIEQPVRPSPIFGAGEKGGAA